MLQPGDSVGGKYRIIRLLGEGGMGTVYEAEHTLVKRRVALKMLRPEYSQNADVVKRFVREAQAAGQIGHENICDVIDIGLAASGPPYLVMQLLQGKPLSKVMVETVPFPIGRGIDIVAQTLEALGAAHDVGIIHRDMKPDNIFLTRTAGRHDFVKLLDFGISKVRTATADAEISITRTGAVLGTPLFMSPEQARGDTDVDGRADVWAVGVIIYQMLSGMNPFEGENYNKTIWNVLSAPIPSLRPLRPGVSRELEIAVMKGLERDPGRRFSTARHFREALLAAWVSVPESGFVLPSAPSSPPPAPDPATPRSPFVIDPRRLRPGAAAAKPAAPTARAPEAGDGRDPTEPYGVLLDGGVTVSDASPGQAKEPTPSLSSTAMTPDATIAARTGVTGPRAQLLRSPIVLAVAAGVLLVGGTLLWVFLLRGGTGTSDQPGQPRPMDARVATTDLGPIAVAANPRTTPSAPPATATPAGGAPATAAAGAPPTGAKVTDVGSPDAGPGFSPAPAADAGRPSGPVVAPASPADGGPTDGMPADARPRAVIRSGSTRTSGTTGRTGPGSAIGLTSPASTTSTSSADAGAGTRAPPTPGEVRRKVDTVRGAVQSCVGGRLPSLSVKVTLDPSGRITRVELVGQGSATGVSGCVTTAVSSVRFEPFTGEAVQVTHLFQFSAPSAPAGTGADAAHGPRFDEEYPE